MTTVGELKLYVRTFLDQDEEDLPDLFMDSWIQHGFDEMVATGIRWPSLEGTAQFITVSGKQAYTVDGSTSGSVPNCRLNEIEYVTLDQYPLEYRDHRELKTAYPPGFKASGTPAFFSFWAKQLFLWPTPPGGLTVTVDFYRQPTDFVAVGAGASPDLPAEFHRPLQEYVLAQAYLKQEDPEMADVHMKNFMRAFDVLRKAEQRAGLGPIILNGGKTTAGRSRLRYPFEYGGMP